MSQNKITNTTTKTSIMKFSTAIVFLTMSKSVIGGGNYYTVNCKEKVWVSDCIDAGFGDKVLDKQCHSYG